MTGGRWQTGQSISVQHANVWQSSTLPPSGGKCFPPGHMIDSK